MSGEAEKRINQVHEIAAGLGWDRAALSLAHEIRSFLETSVADAGTHIDSGGGDGNADLWVMVQGVEYYINIRYSLKELRKRKSHPTSDGGGE